MGKRGITSERAHIIGPMGGRPKGKKNKATLIQLAVKEKFSQRVLRLTDRLINAQASLAIGQTFLYKIEKEFIKTGTKKNGEEDGYWKNLQPKLVEAQSEIESYLEELAENNGDLSDDKDPTATYYFLTTKEPNNNAIDSLHNRVHGKPTESVQVDVNHKFSLKELAQRRISLQNPLPKIIDVEAKVKELLAPENSAEEVS